MGFCSQCGSEVPEGARFCANCGTAVGATGGATAKPVDPAPDPVRTAPAASDATAAPRRPYTPGPVAPGAARGWPDLVLPGMVVLAVLIIGYLFLTPKTDGQRAATLAGRSGATSANRAATPDNGATTGENAVAARDGATHSLGGVADEALGDASADTAAEGRSFGGDTAIPAAALDAAFFRDRDTAARNYAGPVRVSGVIASMVQPGSTPSLAMEGRDRFNYMVVSFPVGYRERLAMLSKGQYITVTCEEVDSMGGTTLLSGCLLV